MRYLLILALPLLLAACATARMDVPAGFAHFDKEESQFLMAAADGFMVRARIAGDGDALAGNLDIALWQKETDGFLTARGYIPATKREVKTGGGMTGTLTEYTILYNGEEHRYAVALFSDGKLLFTVEAGGSAASFEKHRAQVEQAIATLHAD